MIQSDFGKVAEHYARSRNDIPNIFFESLLLRNIMLEGKKTVDIGCGTGVLTRKLKLRHADVVGVDPSVEMLEKAMEASEKERLQIPYFSGTAEATGLESGTFDIVTAMRAWHWFNREPAIREVKRILRPGGTFIVADSAFIPSHSVTDVTFEVLEKYTENGLEPAGSKAESRQRINGFPVEWFEEWHNHGFQFRDFYRLDYEVTFTNQSWVERIASVSWLADMDKETRLAALQELKNRLNEQYAEDAVHTIDHYCSVCILRLSK
ncbi:class I SAM-dependent methyltransferase [Bacillus sp. T33-2]|uniref:class I SAM-dependent methyltransferase n=1 Tax=Bacillus sp. T33-2 TaxID=2054168 RepID=UPI000C760ABE|nr:class I SAM-dependent methyltransferase [Bacillus sp. T33-2]PLR99228.1 class I SAM-dependent methyltransferase [Bacillus sp. T33-2]